MSMRVLCLLLCAAVGCGTSGASAKRPASAAPSTARAHPAAKARRVVVLRLQVGDDGAVSDVQVVRSGGHRFDQAAARAATRAHFDPPLEDGRPIESTLIMTYRFKADPPP
jgi:TonB family protein